MMREGSMTWRCTRCGNEQSAAVNECLGCGAPSTEPPMPNGPLVAGTTLAIGRYRIDSVLGQGGFGITYQAVDTRLMRDVAIKEMFPPGAVRRGTTVVPPTQYIAAFSESKTQFLKEAQNLARFRHRGIVQVFEVFEESATVYLVMEYLRGPTYEQRLRSEGLCTPAAVEHVLREVGGALSALHAGQLLHRDVKPSNLLCVDGEPVLIDFGAARGYDTDSSVAMSRMITPGYSPLEQYAGHARFGPASDLYALCATCYHLVTGVVPVDATDRIQGAELPAPSWLNPATGPRLEAAILAGLQVAVADRPDSIGKLTAFLDSSPTAPPRTVPTELVAGHSHTAAPLLVAPVTSGRRGPNRLAIVVGAAIVVLAIGLAALLLRGGAQPAASGNVDDQATSETTSATTSAAQASTTITASMSSGVVVPVLVGLAAAEAETRLADLGLQVRRSNVEASAENSDLVMASSPAHGTLVASNGTVVLSIGRHTETPKPTAAPTPATSSAPRPTAVEQPPVVADLPPIEAEPVLQGADLAISGYSPTPPPCDGRWVVILRSAAEPYQNRALVLQGLSDYPGSRYFYAPDSCSSFRGVHPSGNTIYAVYYGMYASKDEACNARPDVSTYVKRSDNSTDPLTTYRC